MFVLLFLFCFASCNSDAGSSAAGNHPEEKVFTVGSIPFSTLEGAVNYLKSKSASDDYTIVMHRDAEGKGATISGISAEVAIDFNNHVYTLSGDSDSITVSGCTVEMRDMNMSSGYVVVESNANVSMTGSSAFSGRVSVDDSNLSVNSTSEVTINSLKAKDAVLTCTSNVNIAGFGNTVENSTLNGTSLVTIKNQDPLVIDQWSYTGEMQSLVFHTEETDYQYTFRAKFKFLTSTTCQLYIEYLDGSVWKYFGTNEGNCESEGLLKGKVYWTSQRAYYNWVDYALVFSTNLVKYVPVLTDPDGGTMTFTGVSYEQN